MKIELQKIKIKELVESYESDEKSGAVLEYNKNLNIHPPHQRKFVYKAKQLDEVTRTVFKNFPLNSIYLGKKQQELL